MPPPSPGAHTHALEINDGRRADRRCGRRHSQPGLATAKRRVDIGPLDRERWVEPGEEVFLLHYEGEEHYALWYEGEIFSYPVPPPFDPGEEAEDLDEVRFPEDEDFCTHRGPQAAWWVEVRLRDGRVGWTRGPEDFGNKDACG